MVERATYRDDARHQAGALRMMRPFVAGGTSKPLGLWTTDETGELAAHEPPDETGPGWLITTSESVMRRGGRARRAALWKAIQGKKAIIGGAAAGIAGVR